MDEPAACSPPAATGVERWIRAATHGAWLPFLPAGCREPLARATLVALVAAATLALVAPAVDARGEAWIERAFTRTLGALAATRGLDSAISLAQSSEVSFSFGPGGSLGIGQALDPVNDLVEQYAALLLTSTTALGVQRLGLQVTKALGWRLFLPALVAFLAAVPCGSATRHTLLAWGRRLFGLALFARLALPAAGAIDAWVSDRFLESNYQAAAEQVTATTQHIEQAEATEADRPWYERYNPLDAIGDRARKLYETLSAVGESIVNLAIYFTVSTIVLPLGTLWLLSRATGAVFAPPARGR
ncbi:MAG: hypothetical protein ACKOSQ_05000 [Planctomycetaceae bacterium]